MRPFAGEIYQRIVWNNGKYKNIENHGKTCLDVAGGQNIERMHLTYWDCHHGLNQGWIVDQVDYHYPTNPLKDEVKFQIKTRLTGNRAISYFEDIGGKQYMLRIQNDNPLDKRQWWHFDSRTHTIRNHENKNLVISNRHHSPGFTEGQYAVAREYNGHFTQKIAWFTGAVKNIQNRASQCLDVAGRNPNHRAHLIWYSCHTGHNQAWYADTDGLKIEKYPYADGHAFRIYTKMGSKRVLFANERLNAEEYMLRVRTS